MPGQIESVSQLRSGHLRELARARWWRITMGVPIVVGVLAIFAIPGPNPIAVFVVAVLGLALVATVATYLLADHRAKKDFLRSWARARGWGEDSGQWQERAVPLLRKGDRRDTGACFSGPLPSGATAALAHYTYEVDRRTTNSDGSSSTTTDHHHFTVVEAGAVTPEIPSLSLHPRSWGDNRLFDKLDTKLTSNRVVNLESSELEREYKLEVHDSASELAVRMLFDPAFIVWCIEQAASDLLFEIEDGVLAVAIPDHSYDAAELDGLIDKAAAIAARLAGSAPTAAPAAPLEGDLT